MTRKIICDVCGKEILRPNRLLSEDVPSVVEMSEAERSGLYTKILQCNFRLVTETFVVDEADDLCADCGKLVRDYIRELKKARAEKK
jgi:hypothetical protein